MKSLEDFVNENPDLVYKIAGKVALSFKVWHNAKTNGFYDVLVNERMDFWGMSKEDAEKTVEFDIENRRERFLRKCEEFRK